MSYRLSFDAPLADTLRATAVERFDHAIAALGGEDRAEGVHEVRKDLKKARSLLRLVRPGIETRTYRRENGGLRDIARGVSGVRDADVLVETVDKLAGRCVGRLPERSFATLRERLAERADRAGDPAIDGLVGALGQAGARVDGWGLEGCDAATLTAGAVRAYARGRAALGAVEGDPSDEHLHEWRKRVKDLWYHQRLLRDAWTGPLKAMADESSGLSDLLGDDHDLAVLAARLVESDLAEGSAALDRDTLLTLVADRRGELQAGALRLGRRIYAETAKAYGRRLARYLEAAEAHATAPH